ncbi:MAG: dinitrogenase iron-molybdenum cofactor biosynthesis protein [Lentisphaerae bacterium]|nr:dinitrogenase iron-molybdenum cofactor biosynthesis protein [Lentisphaerota bacterium]
MKIAVSATGKTLEDQVDQRFGRCLYFLVIDSDTMNFEVIENPNQSLGGGAGIQSAQLMAEHDVKAVLTGNVGPNAWQALSAAGIQAFAGAAGGTVRDAVENWKNGKLTVLEQANVGSHFGMGGGGRGGGMGRGMGRGGGGGGGMGGGGRGMGRQ